MALLTRLAVLSFLLMFAWTGAASAREQDVPCWKRLIVYDWRVDGHIDGTYPRHCYDEALRHLKTDARIYSNAEDEIARARLTAIFGGPGVGPRGPTGRGPADVYHHDPGPSELEPDIDSPLNERMNAFFSTNHGSAPIPLYVLGGLAIVLIGAGAAGMLVGKIRRASKGLSRNSAR